MKTRTILVGILMGAAEVVPGVSGGTIAFISGLYERLVDGLCRFTPGFLFTHRKLGVTALWKKLDISFLLLLFGAMLISIALFARGISHLLENYPVGIWSFFFGLVLASVFAVGRKLPMRRPDVIVALVAGAGFGALVTTIVPFEAEVTGAALFLGGCIAVCAWILPGLSGSFILLILGLYQTVIAAVRDFDLVTLSYVGLGCLVGIVSFSRILSALLTHFRESTIALLVGFMMGSLTKLWPWKHTTSYQIKADGSQVPVVQEPVLPDAYLALTQQEPYLVVAGVSCLVGAALILILDRLAFLIEEKADGEES